MMLQTEHDREFYLAKAEEHPLLASVIAGEVTLGKLLDDIIEEMDFTSSVLDSLLLACGDDQAPNRFPDYVESLAGIAPEGIDERTVGRCKSAVERYHSWCGGTLYRAWMWGEATLGTLSASCGATGVILLFAPPLSPFAIPFIMAGAGGASAGSAITVAYALKKIEMKRTCLEELRPVHEAASETDSDIGRCFLYDHFQSARPRFEQTYRSLEPEERKAVDAQLRSYLAAGGIPGTDEQQLKGYLGGLLEQEHKGGA